MLGVNLDYRYTAGYPSIEDVRRHGIGWVRCVSLEVMEFWAGRYLAEGCRVIAVYTGESEQAGRYVMTNASAVQIGNEPLMGHNASWPSGDAQKVVDTWMRVRDRVWRQRGDWFPLMGPGIWSQREDLWLQLADRLEGVTSAAVHVYPDASGHTVADVRTHLETYRSVRPDLPLVCTEWMARWPVSLDVARAIDDSCDSRLWYTWNDPGQPHHALEHTPELGILAWTE